MREHPQLDLRIIGGDQDVSWGGDEGAADLASKFGADRDVLQIWIGGGQAARRGNRLVEAGVNAAGFWMHQQREGVYVRALQLLQAAPLQHQARQLVAER